MKTYLRAMILFLAMNSFANASSANIEGAYVCKSIEIGSHQLYTADAILKKTGEVYSVDSKFNDGSTYHGTGIYDNKKHVLAIVAINPNNPNETGVSIDDVHANGSIEGKWTYLGKTEIGKVTCIKRSV